MASTERVITVLDLYKLWPLLRGVEGARVVNAYRCGETLALRLKGAPMEWLLFSPRVGPVLAGEAPAPLSPYTPLRRHIKGRRIEEAAPLNGDRVLRLGLPSAALILEWIREGNIVVVAPGGEIRYAMRRKKMRDRAVEPGARYVPPPPPKSILELTPEDVISRVDSLASRRLVAAFSIAGGVPGELAYEALYRAGLDPTSRARAADPGDLEKAYWEARRIFLSSLEDRRGFRVGQVGALYPFPPTHLGQHIKEVDYLQAAPGYFASLILRGCSPEEAVEATTYRSLVEAAEKLEKEIKALEENISLLSRLIARYRSLREARLKWSSIDEALSREYPQYRGARHDRWTLLVEIDGLPLEIDAKVTAHQNLVDRYRALKRVRERLLELPSLVQRQPVEKAAMREKEKKRWYEDFRHFTTTGGFIVVAGKSAGQNELLVRRYLEPSDIFLHADIHGAPATIIKTLGREPSERDLLEAAQFAASYSSAWSGGLYAVDVYWVRGSQVSKKAPSGEYLSKGAFMVYGKRNYIRRVKLGLGVGYEEGKGIVALPQIALEGRRGCFLVVEPGRVSKRLVVDKLQRLLKECGVGKTEPGILERLLPKGGFYISRRVVKR